MTLELEGLTKVYKDKTALDDVSFEVKKGEALGIIGHNGAGKSTMLNATAGTFFVDSGKVIIDGSVVQDREL